MASQALALREMRFEQRANADVAFALSSAAASLTLALHLGRLASADRRLWFLLTSVDVLKVGRDEAVDHPFEFIPEPF